MTLENLRKELKKYKKVTNVVVSFQRGTQRLERIISSNQELLMPSWYEPEYGEDFTSALGEAKSGSYEILHEVILLPYKSCMLGADPELFYVKGGKVIPSKFVLGRDYQTVTIDGFQVELHPHTNKCRQLFASNIQDSMLIAEEIGNKVGAKLSFNVGHIISDDVWKSVSISEKRFGCNPTESAYKENHKRVTGLREKFRAGAGHIHLGFSGKVEFNKLVQVMDIVAGNSFVMIDRDEANILRRKNYGRAGEYRVKPYGIEYRVLSNFWLKHYVLMSAAFGLVREAYDIYKAGLYDELLKYVDIKKVQKAINENNYELARENLSGFVRFVKDKKIYGTSIQYDTIDALEAFFTDSKLMSKLGLDKVDHKPMAIRSTGFERFIENNYADKIK